MSMRRILHVAGRIGLFLVGFEVIFNVWFHIFNGFHDTQGLYGIVSRPIKLLLYRFYPVAIDPLLAAMFLQKEFWMILIGCAVLPILSIWLFERFFRHKTRLIIALFYLIVPPLLFLGSNNLIHFLGYG
jgi:hypothetical protein